MSRDDNEGGSATSHREFKDQENDGAGRPTQHQKENEITEANSSRGIKTYRGVYFCKRQGMWVAQVYLPGPKKLALGVYLTAEMAAVARDTGFFFVKEKSDGLNFPRYASRLARPRSHSRKDIRSAARTAARELTPQIIEGQMEQQSEVQLPNSRSPNSADVQLLVKKPRKVGARAAGRMTTQARQETEQIIGDKDQRSGGIQRFRGVYFDKDRRKWVPRVTVQQHKRLSLGEYPTAQMAAIAHDTVFFYSTGNSNGLNFPQFASLLPRPPSDSLKDIRSAARMAVQDLTIQGRLRQELEASAVISARTSAPTVSLTTDMRNSRPANSTKQRIEVAARAAGLITSREQQRPEQTIDLMK